MFNKSSFINVVNGGIWNSMLETFSGIEKYDIPIWEPQKVEGYPGVRAIFFEKTWITDILSTDAFLSLNGTHSLMIASQTGTGKTTFIMKKSLPLMLKSGKKILYLCSRASLAAQMKELAIKDEVNSEVWVGKKQVKDLKKIYSDLGFQQLTKFGGLEIMTFQSFLLNCDELNSREYGAVYIDECQFFVSDATFNSASEIILHKILKKFKDTRKIFLSATPSECVDVIWDVLNQYSDSPYVRQYLDIYYMKPDYSYIIPHFFSRTSDIVSMINNCNDADKRFLIFVKTKKTGEELKETFLENKISTELFSADIDKTDTLYQQLISKGKLPVTCLVATKFLDVGVSIFDKMSLVIYEQDIVEIIQMVGRKRLTNPDEKVHVYFYIPTITELKKRKNALTKKISDVEKSIYAFNEGEYLESIEVPFFIMNKRVDYNMLAIKKLNLELQFCTRLIEFLSDYDDIAERNRAYAKLLLGEFPGVTYCDVDLLLKDPKEELCALLENAIDKSLSKEEFEIFSKEFVKIWGDPRTRTREASPGIKTINAVVKDLGYLFVTSGDPTVYTLTKEVE